MYWEVPSSLNVGVMLCTDQKRKETPAANKCISLDGGMENYVFAVPLLCLDISFQDANMHLFVFFS